MSNKQRAFTRVCLCLPECAARGFSALLPLACNRLPNPIINLELSRF
ncbi:hypothetical protein ABC733_01740 [Mangrovibacter sp. SLW1]